MTRYIPIFATAASLLLLTAFTPITRHAEGWRDGMIPASEQIATDDIADPVPAPAACPTDVNGPADITAYNVQYAGFPAKTVAEWLKDKDFLMEIGTPQDPSMMTYQIGWVFEAATGTYNAYIYDNAGCLFNVIPGVDTNTYGRWTDFK